MGAPSRSSRNSDIRPASNGPVAFAIGANAQRYPVRKARLKQLIIRLIAPQWVARINQNSLHRLPLNLPVDVQKTELSQLSIASKMERVGNKASRRLPTSVGAPTPHFPGV